MKKNIFKILILLLVIYVVSSCEPDKYDVPDIELTPVYTISETGNNSMTKINIYQNLNLLTVWNKDGVVKSYNTTNYSDSSDETNYIITVTANEKKVVEEVMVEIVHSYEISGAKADENVNVTIETTNEDGSTSTSTLSGKIEEDEIYN